MLLKNILAVRNDRFGEFLLNIPVFRALKTHYPQARLMVVVDPYVQPLAQRIPFIDEIIHWRSSIRHPLREKIAFIHSLRNKRLDMALILNPSKEFNFYSYFAGVPLRVGYDRKCAFLLNRRLPDRKFEGTRHEADYNLALLGLLGIKVEQPDFIGGLQISADDFPTLRLQAEGLADKAFVVLHPWSSNSAKEWGLDNFRELARALTERFKSKLVIIGGRNEISRAGEFSRSLSLMNLTGRTTLLELAGLLKRAKLLVTNDSGPMHLSAILNTPVVALFRKGPPAVSAKRWGPLGLGHIVLENELIRDIKVSEVFDAVKKILP